VTVYVVPKVGETSGSSLLNIFGAALSGATGTPHYSHHKYEFKADLEDMEVLVDSVAVPEIQRGMTWQPLDFSTGGYGWSASGEDLARAGLAVYEFNLFQPGQNGWPTIEIQLTDQRKPDTEIRFPLPRRTLERIALDFEHYSWVERAREIAIVIDGHGIGGRQ
jgi:hypothetical protein